MKAKEIQELIDFIAKSELDEVKIETDDLKLSIKRNTAEKVVEKTVQTVVAEPQPVYTPPQPVSTPVVQATPKAQEVPQESSPTKDLVAIESPMIGTFYRSANPESPPFVNVGDEVKVGQTVGIIEAMKLFNEIESEVAGKIVQVKVENATPVEYGHILFWVEPA